MTLLLLTLERLLWITALFAVMSLFGLAVGLYEQVWQDEDDSKEESW